MSIRTAFVATFPPRHCGIAAFTHDLSAVVGPHEVVALEQVKGDLRHPHQVHHRIRRDVATDYGRAAHALRSCDIDVVSLQHEYGIWGSNDGIRVLDFVSGLNQPLVATLHTVLRHPTPRQHLILSELVKAAATTVVMSESAAALLKQRYAIGNARIQVIPHGVPNLDYVGTSRARRHIGLAAGPVLLSFGLLGPGKGYELAIEAMPEIVAAAPEALYVVLGATHPELLEAEGEKYRRGLAERAAVLGMADNVLFVDRYVSTSTLVHWLQASDVVVTPYPNLDQIVSGALCYAMAAGRPVVSTPFAYAAEQLDGDRGVLFAPRSSEQLAEEVNRLLADPLARERIGRRAWDHTRHMVWPEVGAAYRRVFQRLARRLPVVTRVAAQRESVVVAAS